MSKESLLGRIVRRIDKRGRPYGPPLFLISMHGSCEVYDGVRVKVDKRFRALTYTKEREQVNGDRPLRVLDEMELL